jgi:hypothetical protein
MSNTTTSPEVKIIPFHSLAKHFPLLNGAEFNELVADIKSHGLNEPITIYQDKILDGRNRWRACVKAKVEPRFEQFKGDDAGAVAFVCSKNIHRRHLKAKEKREAIASLLKAKPETSNNAIAKQAKVDDKTVAKVRRELESTSEIPKLDKTVGADGKARKQPTQKQGAFGRSPAQRHPTQPSEKKKRRTSEEIGVEKFKHAVWCVTCSSETLSDIPVPQHLSAKDVDEAVKQIGCLEQALRAFADRIKQVRSGPKLGLEGNGADAEASADKRREQFAAIEAGERIPSSLPDIPRRDKRRDKPILIEGTAKHIN